MYTLAIVAQLQRGAEPKVNQDLTILVPPYDPARIFRLSYEPDGLAELDLKSDRCDASACWTRCFRSHKLTEVVLPDGHPRSAVIALPYLLGFTLAQKPYPEGRTLRLHQIQDSRLQDFVHVQGAPAQHAEEVYNVPCHDHNLIEQRLSTNYGFPTSRSSTPEPEAPVEKAEEAAAGDRAAQQTGLGVAGMLRRIGLWAKEDAAHGRITIAGKELLRWKRAADRSPFPLPSSCDTLVTTA